MTYSPFIPYQTVNDLNREHQIIEFLSKKWRFEYKKLGDYSVFDFLCFRGDNPVAYIEVKTKNRSVNDYDTYICTTKDIDYGLQLSAETGIPSFVVVKWFDDFAYVKLTHNQYYSRKSGQTNRNDPRDYNEIVYEMPYKEFRRIKGFNFNE